MISNTAPTQQMNEIVVALVGNPNVGKSTLFNEITGGKQHTGNWPGKTVDVAVGSYVHKGKNYTLVDLPGTYSLNPSSKDEQETIDFLKSNRVHCVLVVGDATALERNLTLLFQVMMITSNVLFCVNLMDEAHRRQIQIDLCLLEKSLGIPVLGCSAAQGVGVADLKDKIRNMVDGFVVSNPILPEERLIPLCAKEIAASVSSGEVCQKSNITDCILLGKWTGYLCMIGLLYLILWLTVSGANYVSDFLGMQFQQVGLLLKKWTSWLPEAVSSLMLDGIYWTVSTVVSVMLPPLMIFFPLFSYLEDLGYLPRAAFLSDHVFQSCGGCGKQALTMAMGLGCNMVGITGCRIISSPREKLIAAATNSLTPCNGRFPTILVMIGLFLTNNNLIKAFILLLLLIFGVLITLLSSKILHYTMFRKEDSEFIMEIPPFRKPNLKKIFRETWCNRCIAIIVRAVLVSIPAGMIIWLLQIIKVSDQTMLHVISNWLDPVAGMIGMNGAIVLAFFLSLPANELFLPIALMILSGHSASDNIMQNISVIFSNCEIAWKTGVCMIMFTMFHWPCLNTIITVYKELQSYKWTLISILLPTGVGFTLCLLFTALF